MTKVISMAKAKVAYFILYAELGEKLFAIFYERHGDSPVLKDGYQTGLN
ncbi:MAG: hypothetical protein ACXV8I_02605 [Methylobacter sp.]